LILGDGDAKNDWVTGTDKGTSSVELSAPNGCEVTAVGMTDTGAAAGVPGAGTGVPRNDWEAGESPTGVTSRTAGSAVISELGDTPKSNQSDQSSNGREPTGAADLLGSPELEARRSANSSGSETVSDVTPRKSRGAGLEERERSRGGRICSSESSGSTLGISKMEISGTEWMGEESSELEVTTGAAPSAAEGGSAMRI